MSDAEKLIELAKKRFKDFCEADEILFTAVAAGNSADYSEEGDKDNLANADNWRKKRIIKADRIEWLCRDRQAKELIMNKGVQVEGAKIEEAVNLSFAEISFPLAFFRCVFTEEINIHHSRIRALNLNGSHTYSIRADGIKVEGDVFFQYGFKVKGEVCFTGAVIDGDFACEGGDFINENGNAILADRMNVKKGVYLRGGLKAKGEVHFIGVRIGGNFDCSNGEFINKKGWAISADGMDVSGGVFLKNGFKADGEVCFVGTVIGGNFECDNGEFINEKRVAISADGMNVKGGVFLRDGFKAKGEVRFLGATIGGDFDCTKGEFINEKGDAISADGMDVKVGVFLRDSFKAEGRVSLLGARIGSYFSWEGVKLIDKIRLDLRNAKTGTLWDDVKSWPKKGNLFLDGFVYEDIGDYAPKDAESRIEWLNRQGEEHFRPGPYEQLAKVLNKIGHSEDAKKILIEKEKKITRQSSLGWKRFWRSVLGVTIGYGYRPWRALWFIGFFILLGYGIFWSGHKTGVIVPVEKEAYISEQGGQLRDGYPRFNSLVYSVEMFVPVVDLRMAKYWMPDANKSGMLCFKKYRLNIKGDFVRWYMWFHIGAGWMFTTLLVVGLTGLVKK